MKLRRLASVFAVVYFLPLSGGLAAEPPQTAICPRGALLPACVFFDDFESSSLCYWSSQIGAVEISCDVCGDGILHPGTEQCDDGNLTNGDGCSSFCLFEYCGNGTINSANGEQCDDGNTDDLDSCRNNCRLPACGDGVLSASETCDTGGNSATCDYDCTLPSCGDGVTNPAASEQCDDGNNANGDGCSSACKFELCPAGPAGGSR